VGVYAGFGRYPVVGAIQHSNGPLGFVKGEEFPDQSESVRLLRMI
jgi:hypothetical protein